MYIISILQKLPCNVNEKLLLLNKISEAPLVQQPSPKNTPAYTIKYAIPLAKSMNYWGKPQNVNI